MGKTRSKICKGHTLEIALGIMILVSLLANVYIAGATLGDLDTSFGSGGKVTTDFGGVDVAYAIAIQSDGKIVAAGVGETTYDFALARYNSDGTLDTSFGSGGKVTTDFGGTSATAYAIAIQSDGKIVAAGVGGTTYDFALARYNSDGTLDTSFGSGGKVTTDFGGGDGAFAIAIQSDGRIVAIGSNSPLGALARYNKDGTLDTSFGTAGKVTTGLLRNAFDIAIQPDGKIVVAGFSYTETGDIDFALARYNSDGTLDTSFGSGGKVTTDFGRGDGASAIAIQRDGKIVAAGSTNSISIGESFALARYNSDGTLDTSFGSGGKVITDFAGTGSYTGAGANAIAIQSDGKIVAAGIGIGGTTYDFALARYNSDGTLDTSFGSGGKVTTDFGGGMDEATAIAIQSDGRIVAAGFIYYTETNLDFALARYKGTLDFTPPTTVISISGTAGNNGWWKTDVIVTLTATDDQSGVANTYYSLDGGATWSTYASTFTITEGTNILQYYSVDKASPPNQETIKIENIKIDKTPPSISFSGPATVNLGSAASVTVSVTDSLSGVAYQSAPDGANALDTSTVGTKTFTVTARDNAGNEASVTYTYRVIYDFTGAGGFQPPISNTATNTGKAGSVIPVKWQLPDGSGGFISDLSVIVSIIYQQASCDFSSTFNEVPADTSGNTGLRYDTTTNQFIYSWKTPYAAGCYVLVLKLNDGSEYRAYFALR